MKFLVIFALALSNAFAFCMAYSKLGITNGQKAPAGKFPYQVGLAVNTGAYKLGWCGGSLIDKKWVLTSARCTGIAISVTVYLGGNERLKSEVTYTVNREDIISHPRWDRSLKNDISLIRIPYTNTTDNINLVRLPTNADVNSTYVGEKVLISGWGFVSDSSENFATDLQYGLIEVVKNRICEKLYGPKIKPRIICASTTGGVSPCLGDSGGPLVLESSKIQVGVASFRYYKGCALGYPVAFTRVTHYLNWIKSITGVGN